MSLPTPRTLLKKLSTETTSVQGTKDKVVNISGSIMRNGGNLIRNLSFGRRKKPKSKADDGSGQGHKAQDEPKAKPTDEVPLTRESAEQKEEGSVTLDNLEEYWSNLEVQIGKQLSSDSSLSDVSLRPSPIALSPEVIVAPPKESTIEESEQEQLRTAVELAQHAIETAITHAEEVAVVREVASSPEPPPPNAPSKYELLEPPTPDTLAAMREIALAMEEAAREEEAAVRAAPCALAAAADEPMPAPEAALMLEQAPLEAAKATELASPSNIQGRIEADALELAEVERTELARKLVSEMISRVFSRVVAAAAVANESVEPAMRPDEAGLSNEIDAEIDECNMEAADKAAAELAVSVAVDASSPLREIRSGTAAQPLGPMPSNLSSYLQLIESSPIGPGARRGFGIGGEATGAWAKLDSPKMVSPRQGSPQAIESQLIEAHDEVEDAVRTVLVSDAHLDAPSKTAAATQATAAQEGGSLCVALRACLAH